MIGRKLLNDKGFTLAEVVVGAGLAGLVGLGIMHSMKAVNTQVSNSRKQNSRSSIMNTLVKYGERGSQVLKQEDFHHLGTYYNSSRTEVVPIKVSYISNRGEGTSTFVHKDANKTIRNDSFAMKLNNLNTADKDNIKNTGALISRCIVKSHVDKEFSLEEVLNLDLVPLIRYDGAKKNIFCCSLSDLTCGGRISKDSNHRPRVFYVNAKKVQMYPSKTQAREVSGVGFNLFLDKATDAEGYQLILFSLVNDCLINADKNVNRACRDNNLISQRIIEGNLAKDIHDSGMIILGQ